MSTSADQKDNDSNFYKWRCFIALAYVDNKLHEKEIEFITKGIDEIPDDEISDKQRKILQKDIYDKKDPETFFKHITDPLDKLDLMRMAYLLFWADGEFDEREESFYNNFRKAVARSLNLEPDVIDTLVHMQINSKSVSIRKKLKEVMAKESLDKDEKKEIDMPPPPAEKPKKTAQNAKAKEKTKKEFDLDNMYDDDMDIEFRDIP